MTANVSYKSEMYHGKTTQNVTILSIRGVLVRVPFSFFLFLVESFLTNTCTDQTNHGNDVILYTFKLPYIKLWWVWGFHPLAKTEGVDPK